jgi:hypothetical protein
MENGQRRLTKKSPKYQFAVDINANHLAQFKASMTPDKPNESDWKRFRAIVPELRERYLKKKNRDILLVLTDPDKTPTEQFWAAEEKIREEEKIFRECFESPSRSRMRLLMGVMYAYNILDDKDLESFSDELRESFRDWDSL